MTEAPRLAYPQYGMPDMQSSHIQQIQDMLPERMAKLTKAIQVRFAPEELAALDAYCAEGRRVTGELFARTEVIRLAIAKLVAARPDKPSPEPNVREASPKPPSASTQQVRPLYRDAAKGRF